MSFIEIHKLFEVNKEESLYHRYITNEKIAPLLKYLKNHFEIKEIGQSVLGDSIHSITLGKGDIKVFMWSQMHGNESTTTKALFDLLNTFINNANDVTAILNNCTLCIIPILNPDGAKAYTRVNANKIDLNRDAQIKSQPESIVLRKVFEHFKPHFCFNLHGQRTIFSAGNTNKSAIVSFLSPSQDEACSITSTRKIAMEVIAQMNKTLQEVIPNQVGVYDDAFNINCVGDTFQSEYVPTILFEAGHFPEDYSREKTRKLIYGSYISALNYIATNDVTGNAHENYFNIPENEKLFFDIIIRKAIVDDELVDVAIQYEERLVGDELKFIPIIKKIELLPSFFGHKEFFANGQFIKAKGNLSLKIDSENDFVMINNEKLMLTLK